MNISDFKSDGNFANLGILLFAGAEIVRAVRKGSFSGKSKYVRKAP